jgi:hypothetical protein
MWQLEPIYQQVSRQVCASEKAQLCQKVVGEAGICAADAAKGLSDWQVELAAKQKRAGGAAG